jgi:FkbM family methyltransferase
MDLLITLHRKLQWTVDVFHLRPLAQRVFRGLLAHRYREGRLVRATQNGREWWLDTEVALRGEFAEYETIEWLRGVVKPGMTVVDVGANVGQMTLEMAHLVGPRGKVFAIEPAPGNVRILREHIRGNGFDDRVTVIEAACCENDGGSIDLTVFGSATDTVGSGHTIMAEAASAAAPHALPTLSLRVPTVSLDALCERCAIRPGVLKIDVEGAERSVLEGARRILAQDRPRLRFGFHPFAFADPAAASAGIRAILAEARYRIDETADETAFSLAEYEAFPDDNRPLPRVRAQDSKGSCPHVPFLLPRRPRRNLP